MVKAFGYDEGRRYNPQDLEEHLLEIPTGNGTKANPVKIDLTNLPEVPWSKIKSLAEFLPKFAATWEHKRPDFDSPSEYDFSIIGFLLQVECTNEEILAALFEWRRRHGYDLKKLRRTWNEGKENYAAYCIAKVRSEMGLSSFDHLEGKENAEETIISHKTR